MNIIELKNSINAKIGANLGTLSMVRQFALKEDGTIDETKPTEWVSHWDNDHRVRVSMHQDVMNAIKQDPNKALAFKYEMVPATPDRAAYRRFIVITPNNVEATF